MPKAAKGSWVHVEGWTGKYGRVWKDSRGKLNFHIRVQRDGVRRSVATGATSLRAALAHVERFEKQPEAYRPAGDPGEAPLYLDADPDADGLPALVRAFLRWSRDELGNTPAWVGKQQSCLAWWMEELRGVNLRRASLRDHILPALEGKVPGRAHKIRVLKTFFAWLRKEKHLIAAHEDPTFGTLPAPQAKPEQWKHTKVIPRDHLDLVVEHLQAEEEERRKERAKRPAKVVPLVKPPPEPRDAPWSDALIVQAGTGWHTTELVRFAAAGTIEPLPQSVVQEGVAGVLCITLHKSGEPIRTRVSETVLEAAKRLRAHGAISREWYDRAVRAACEAVKRPDGKVGIDVFTPGRLRHSVATWAIQAGADPAMVSAYLGHKSPRTTRKFYAVHASPAKVPTLR